MELVRLYSREGGLTTDGRAQRMFQLYSSGLSLAQVGSVFGVSRQRVAQILKDYPGYIEFDYQSEAWRKRLKALVMERDFLRCVCCGQEERLAVHHIDGDYRHNSLSNLVTLCPSCHASSHCKGENRTEVNNDLTIKVKHNSGNALGQGCGKTQMERKANPLSNTINEYTPGERLDIRTLGNVWREKEK